MRPLLLCLALLAVALTGGIRCATHDQDRQELYRWFDSLGYSPLKDGKFVRVDHSSTWGPKSEIQYSDYGFLKRGSGKTFTALTLRLTDIMVVDGKPIGEDRGEGLDAVPIDLGNWLTEQKRLWGSSSAYSLDFGSSDGFVLARLADLRGYGDLADFFYNSSKAAPSYGDESRTYTHRVQEGIASSLLWEARADFRQTAIPRSDLAVKFQFVVDHFPPSKVRDEASQVLEGLAPMIREDAVRKPLTDSELKKLSPAQQASELVWQLRDQVADQFMQPGYTEVFPLGQVNRGNPADKLVKLGWAAIRPLLDALHDKRYIRAAQGGMRSSRQVLRIRDAAIQILDKIGNRSFSSSEEGVPGDDDKIAAQIEDHARQWWSGMQKLGQREMMVRAIKRGDRESATQAEPFAKSYPKDALATIRIGVATAREPYIRQQLIGALLHVDTPAVRSYASEQMTTGKDLGTRVAAANVVAIHDPAGAIRAMAREWRNLPAKPSLDRWDDDSLRTFLTNVGYASGIEALARDLGRQPIDRRMDVVERVDEGDFRGRAKGVPAREKRLRDRAVENLLASVLLDRDQAFGQGGTFGDYSFQDPRICDMASYQLTSAWPHKYKFTNPSSRFERDRGCAENMNAWRRSRGLPARPLPRRAVLSPTPDSVMTPLIAKLASGSPAEQKVARRAIEGKGIHALTRLMKEARKAPAGSASKAALDDLSRKSSCTLTSLTLKAFPPPTSELAAFIRGYKGRPVTAGFVHEVLARAIAHWPRTARGFTLTASRDNDGLGISLTAGFGEPIPSGVTGGLDYREGVTLNGKSIDGVTGGSSAIEYAWSGFDAAVGKALSSPPLVPFEFYISIEREARG